MSKLITVHESEWDKLEAEIKRLEKLATDISYTAKNRKEKMHLYRDALIEIGHWTETTQTYAEKMHAGLGMWRGCVASANGALEKGGDAVEGRERVYPDGYLEGKANE